MQSSMQRKVLAFLLLWTSITPSKVTNFCDNIAINHPCPSHNSVIVTTLLGIRRQDPPGLQLCNVRACFYPPGPNLEAISLRRPYSTSHYPIHAKLPISLFSHADCIRCRRRSPHTNIKVYVNLLLSAYVPVYPHNPYQVSYTKTPISSNHTCSETNGMLMLVQACHDHWGGFGPTPISRPSRLGQADSVAAYMQCD